MYGILSVLNQQYSVYKEILKEMTAEQILRLFPISLKIGSCEGYWNGLIDLANKSPDLEKSKYQDVIESILNLSAKSQEYVTLKSAIVSASSSILWIKNMSLLKSILSFLEPTDLNDIKDDRPRIYFGLKLMEFEGECYKDPKHDNYQALAEFFIKNLTNSIYGDCVNYSAIVKISSFLEPLINNIDLEKIESPLARLQIQLELFMAGKTGREEIILSKFKTFPRKEGGSSPVKLDYPIKNPKTMDLWMLLAKHHKELPLPSYYVKSTFSSLLEVHGVGCVNKISTEVLKELVTLGYSVNKILEGASSDFLRELVEGIEAESFNKHLWSYEGFILEKWSSFDFMKLYEMVYKDPEKVVHVEQHLHRQPEIFATLIFDFYSKQPSLEFAKFIERINKIELDRRWILDPFAKMLPCLNFT